MRFLLLNLLVLLASASDDDFEFEMGKTKLNNRLFVLNDANFDENMESKRYLAVFFFDPNKPSQLDQLKEFEVVAKRLETQNILVKMCRVNVSEAPRIAERLSLSKLPAIKFFWVKEMHQFDQRFTETDIYEWIVAKTRDPTLMVSSKEYMEALVQRHSVVAVSTLEDRKGDLNKAFREAATKSGTYLFVVAQKEAVDHRDAVYLKKNYDDKLVLMDKNRLKDVDAEKVLSWVRFESQMLVPEFDLSTMELLFANELAWHLILWRNKELEGAAIFEQEKELLKPLAKSLRGDVQFVFMDSSKNFTWQPLDFVGAKDEYDKAGFTLFNPVKNFKWSRIRNRWPDIFEAATFIHDAREGRIDRTLLSEKPEEGWHRKPVKRLVATTFERAVNDKKKDVFVYFFSDVYCRPEVCGKVSEIWEKLGEAFAKNGWVTIAKIEISFNDIKDFVTVPDVPHFILYKSKTNEQVVYTGKQTLEAFTKFLETGEITSSDAKKTNLNNNGMNGKEDSEHGKNKKKKGSKKNTKVDKNKEEL